MKIIFGLLLIGAMVFFGACRFSDNKQVTKAVLNIEPFPLVADDTLFSDSIYNYSIVASRKLTREFPNAPNIKLWLETPNFSFFSVRITRIPEKYLNQALHLGSDLEGFLNTEVKVNKENGGRVSNPKGAYIIIGGYTGTQFAADINDNSYYDGELHKYTSTVIAVKNNLFIIHCRNFNNDSLLNDSINSRMLNSLRFF